MCGGGGGVGGCMCVVMCTYQRPQESGPPGAGVTGVCEPVDLDI